jgi:hypothetical protein
MGRVPLELNRLAVSLRHPIFARKPAAERAVPAGASIYRADAFCGVDAWFK